MLHFCRQSHTALVLGPSSRLKERFVAGLIPVVPLAVTLYISRILMSWSLQFVNPVVAEFGLIETTANVELAAQVLAVVLIFAVITALGLLHSGRPGDTSSATSAGRAMSSRW